MRAKWIPEAPDYLGVYAVDPDANPPATMTLDVNAAIWFETYEGCALWCTVHTWPVFVPREHLWPE